MTTPRQSRYFHDDDDARDLADDLDAEYAERLARERCHGHDLPGTHQCSDLCTVNSCCEGNLR